MREIYNELKRHSGKLTEFAQVLVDRGLYTNTKHCVAMMRHSTKYRQDVQDIYSEWKPGKLKTRDVTKHNEKLSEVFRSIKKKEVKEKIETMCEILEESLMIVTLAIKHSDVGKLGEVKKNIENILYGANNG